MAIIERKQLTGTTQQINAYAGHQGQLAFDKTTKHLHVLSGTAGASTKLANVSDIPAPVDISGKADKTYVDTELAKKQPTGDYATNSALTAGLAGKLDATGKAQTAGTADTAKALATSAKVPYSQITGAPSIPSVSGLVPKTGDIGRFMAYEELVAINTNATITLDSPSAVVLNGSVAGSTQDYTLNIQPGILGKYCTKLIYVYNVNTLTIKVTNTDVSFTWTNNKAPTFKKHNIIVLQYHNENTLNASLASSWG